MSKMAQLHADQNDDLMECAYAQEEQAFYHAVQEVKSFIDSGAVTFEQVEKMLRGIEDGGH